jgi:ribose-phosphate pyrophosphokinase
MLQELISLGVDNILTFDAHDPRVQNAIPISGFDNIQPTYQFVKSLVEQCDDVHFDNDHLMVISPDEGAMQRAIYMANVVGVDVGMFYKRRDYSTIVDGRNPIVAHEFLGADVRGKDMIIVDDMIDTAGTICMASDMLMEKGAKSVRAAITHPILSGQAYEKINASALQEVIVTDTIPLNPEKDLSKFKVMTVADIFANVIERVHNYKEISSIFFK